MAKEPGSPSRVFPLSRGFGDSGEVVTEIQHIAIFDTRAPASAIPHICHLHWLRPHSGQIYLGGHLLGVCRSSLGLYRISWQLFRGEARQTDIEVACL